MKKFKTQKNLLIFMICIAGVLLSCARDNSIEQLKDLPAEAEIAEAKLWFEEQMYSENYLTNESVMHLYKDWMPDWNKATVNILTKSISVEVPLIFMKEVDVLSPKFLAEYERTRDSKYLQFDVRLVIQTSISTGNKRDFLMQVSPSLKYLQTKNPGSYSYLNMEEDFDGAVLYYDLTWKFINGWKYSNGEIINEFVSRETLEKMVIATRGHEITWECESMADYSNMIEYTGCVQVGGNSYPYNNYPYTSPPNSNHPSMSEFYPPNHDAPRYGTPRNPNQPDDRDWQGDDSDCWW